jgi:hypothetical protein
MWLDPKSNCRLGFKKRHMWCLSLIDILSSVNTLSTFLTDLPVTHFRMPTLVSVTSWPRITYNTYAFNAM